MSRCSANRLTTSRGASRVMSGPVDHRKRLAPLAHLHDGAGPAAQSTAHATSFSSRSFWRAPRRSKLEAWSGVSRLGAASTSP